MAKPKCCGPRYSVNILLRHFRKSTIGAIVGRTSRFPDIHFPDVAGAAALAAASASAFCLSNSCSISTNVLPGLSVLPANAGWFTAYRVARNSVFPGLGGAPRPAAAATCRFLKVRDQGFLGSRSRSPQSWD